MARLGYQYGSEWNLRWYGEHRRDVMNRAISEAVGGSGLTWLYPAGAGSAEATSGDYLAARHPGLVPAWKEWWPQTGTQPTWDAIAALNIGGVDHAAVLEAKGNHPEFVGDPSHARGDGRKRIEEALQDVQATLGVHRQFCWLGSYYQYANRLAFLWFLKQHDVAAKLVYLYFVGDVMKNGQPCPSSEDEWRVLFEARRLTLGLPTQHEILNDVHAVFLPAYKTLHQATYVR